MPRCAIFTMVGYNNYGNRLVCAATCKILASLGVDAEIVLVKNEDKYITPFIKFKRNVKNAFRRSFGQMLIKVFYFFPRLFARYYIKIITRQTIKTRHLRFVDFSAEHIVEKDYGLTKYVFPPSFPSYFDFFVLGGDQVWNPFFPLANTPETVYFMPFAGNGKRAFMFSTSFGVSKNVFFEQTAKVPGLIDAYRDALSKMNAISCREDAGMEIINSLAKEGQVLIDPTMILTREEWLQTAKKPDFLASRVNGKNGYAVLFFLGKIPSFLKMRIKKICRDKNLEPIALDNPFDKPAYVAGPAEFIHIMANAGFVYTDSFHGTAFSILFEIPFFAFNRLGDKVDMSSRFDTLLRKFNLEERFVANIKEFYPADSDLGMSFSETREILSREREKAINFLKAVIG